MSTEIGFGIALLLIGGAVSLMMGGVLLFAFWVAGYSLRRIHRRW